MINEKINESFLNILSPPSFNKEFGNHPTIKCSYKNYIKEFSNIQL